VSISKPQVRRNVLKVVELDRANTRRKRMTNYWRKIGIPYAAATIAVALITALIAVLHADRHASNISMLYLLVVTVAALLLGRGASIYCSILSFLAFDWFFVEPRHQLTVSSFSEWLALCMFLLTAIIIGQLTALLRKRMEEAQKSRNETAALAEASWAVASDIDRDRVLMKLLETILKVSAADAVSMCLHPNELDETVWIQSNCPIQESDLSKEAISHVLVRGQSIGWDDSPHWKKAFGDLKKSELIYLPITLNNEIFGVICMRLKPGAHLEDSEKNIINSVVNHAGVVLHRDKLLQIQTQAKALSEVDRLKTALLSMVSHDFRSPLTSIKASVGSMLQKNSSIDAETQTQLLQGVDQEADRLNKMVGNILDLSRLEADAWTPKTELTTVTELVGSVLDSFGEEENKRIKVDIADRDKEFSLDSVQMTQVLRNLIENALKYSKDEVTVKFYNGNNMMNIDVIDRGPGLPRGEEKEIFKPFHRSRSLQESSTPGMGVGLAVCKGLVEAHKGTITAANQNGGGAVFHISLPQDNGDKKGQ
jgi:two-component system sensor histidine kinase KdpD